VQAEGGGKDGQAAEDHAFGLGQQLEAPVERRAQGPMPRERRPPAASQQIEAIIEVGGKLLEAQHGGTRCRQLYRQRYAVELTAHRRDCRTNMTILRQTRAAAAGTGGEQLNCTVLPWVVVFGGRHGKGRHRVDLLSFHPQRFAAGGDNAHPWSGPQHGFGQLRGCVDDVFAGVQHQQQPATGYRLCDATRRNLAGCKFYPDRCGHCGGNQTRIGQGRELGHPHAIAKFRQQRSRDRRGEPCLANTTGAGEGDEPMRSGKVQDFPHLILPADQLGNRF
jgi:hypothetical protein